MFSPTHTIQSPPKVKKQQQYIGSLSAYAPRRQPVTTLQMLTDDILLLIISFVEVRDILALRQTSKHFLNMSKLRWVWLDAIQRHVVDRGLPVPAGGIDLLTLSAKQLEARAVHASNFHKNWSSPQPTARYTFSFNADKCLPDEEPDDHKSTVTQVAFLKGSSGQLLVTAVGRVITCWEVPFGGASAYRVAEHVAPCPVEQLIPNEDEDGEAALAYLTGSSAPTDPANVVVLRLDKFHGIFRESSRLRSVRAMVHPLHVMHDSYVVLGHSPTIWYYKEPVKAVSLQSTIPAVQAGSIRAVKVINRYMVVVRESHVQFVYAPVWKGKRTAWGQQPRSLFEMRTSVTDATIIHQGAVGEESWEWPSTPVTLLLRCREDDIDAILQIDLLPGGHNPDAAHDLDSFSPLNALPFAWCRRVTAIPVPPSCQHLHAGPSGRGFTIQTRTMTSRRIEHPARCLFGFHTTPVSDKLQLGDSEAWGREHRIAAGVSKGNKVHYADRPCYSRRCDMSEVVKRQYTIVSTAFEDTVGRLAIGDKHGIVEVLDFA